MLTALNSRKWCSSSSELYPLQKKILSHAHVSVKGTGLAIVLSEYTSIPQNTTREDTPAQPSSMKPVNSQVMRTGVWSQDEHQRYIQAIRELPGQPWKTIAAFIGTRTERQVLSHHQKFVRKCKRFAVNPRALRAEHPVDFSVLPHTSGNQSGAELSEEEVAALTHSFINEWTPLDDNVKLEETPTCPETMGDSLFFDDFAAFDRYIQQILNAKTLEELNTICGL